MIIFIIAFQLFKSKTFFADVLLAKCRFKRKSKKKVKANFKDHQSFTIHVCLSLGAWIPSVQSTSEYLQIDLLQVRNISGIMTQGRDEAECGCSEWVTEYTLSYSLCGSFWSDYKANGSIKVASIHQYLCTCRQRFYQHRYHCNSYVDVTCIRAFL